MRHRIDGHLTLRHREHTFYQTLPSSPPSIEELKPYSKLQRIAAYAADLLSRPPETYAKETGIHQEI